MKRIIIISLCVMMVASVTLVATDSNWEFLSTQTIKAKEFLKEHPNYDGRGVLIAVCDSGVDLGLNGLLKTSDGKDKIVDARDFSGEYKIECEKPTFGEDGSIFLEDEKHLFNLKEEITDFDSNDIYLGYLKEKSAINSEVNDLNGNGKEDDVFGFVLFKDKKDGIYKVLIDSNGDGDLKGEKSYADFSYKREFFALQGRDRFSQYAPLTIAVNIDEEKKVVDFFMADGSHGTHVAGICAGFMIDGQEGYNGIAPGAQILALKIGNNSFAGGATTEGSMVSAWRYAVKKAKELNMPLIIQMSYGIGSEIEGRAKAEELLDELLEENPDVVATVSCGNEGPGISTAGLPASAKNVLAIGALLANTTAKDIYGADLKQDEIFSFSSRGADMLKPDVVCPGFAASTVPLWEEGKNVMRGTSMASPQAAGALAILISAFKQEGLKIERDAIYSAVRRGAVFINGYTILDQGSGLLNIKNAYEIYKQIIKGDNRVLSFDVETISPQYPDKRGSAVYYRGAYYPKKGERQEIKVIPRFPSNFTKEQVEKFYLAFDIEKEGNFFSVIQTSTYIKAEKYAEIFLTFDENVLSKEGLYSGVINLYKKGENKNLGPILKIPVTVVIPYEIKDSFYKEIETDVEKAKVKRLYFRVQEGCQQVAINISSENISGKILVQLFDPAGREKTFQLLSKGKKEVTIPIKPLDERGVYELTLYGNYLNKSNEKVKIKIINAPIFANIEEGLRVKVGEKCSFKVGLISSMKESFKGEIESNIVSVFKEDKEEVKGANFSRSFTFGENDSKVAFDIELSPQDFNLFTDISVTIVDEDGKAVVSDGMTYRFLMIETSLEDGVKLNKKYTLKIHSAYAEENSKEKWQIKIKEIHYFKERNSCELKDSKNLELFPDIKRTILVKTNPPPTIPEKWQYLLSLTLKAKEEKFATFIYELPLIVER